MGQEITHWKLKPEEAKAVVEVLARELEKRGSIAHPIFLKIAEDYCNYKTDRDRTGLTVEDSVGVFWNLEWHFSENTMLSKEDFQTIVEDFRAMGVRRS